MNRWIIGGLGLLLLILFIIGAYDFYDRLEIIETTKKITLEGEARKNPLYAARIFLNRMGIPAQSKPSLQGLDSLPDHNTVLVISSKRSTLSQQATQNLYRWVEKGGHLMVRSTRPDDSFYAGFANKDYQLSDPLQALLNIETGGRVDVDKKESILLELQGSKHPLVLEIKKFSPIRYLDSESEKTDEILHIKNNIFMLRRSIGDGMITLASDLNFIDNRNIRKADHAELFWELVHGLSEPNQVWLIHNDEMPALWQLMWNKASALILTLLILFLLWLRHASHRFGPLIPKANQDRRSLLEHINASGRFYWQHQQKSKLIASTREALNQRLILSHPGWTQLSDAEKITQLAQRLQRPQDEIKQLLFDRNYALKKNQSSEFTQLIQQLEQIRNSL